MIKIFVIGFPHTATTYCYKYLLEKFPRHMGIFEPFNAEVVDWCMELNHTYHYSEGKVKHHLLHLPPLLIQLIYENSRWLWDWVDNDKPSTEFLGNAWSNVLTSLDSVTERFIVKDVCAWVRLKEIVELLPRTKFIILVKDKESVFNDFLTLYRQTLQVKDYRKTHGRWLLGLGLFYRYFYGVENYPRHVDEIVLKRVFDDVYSRYCNIASYIETHHKYRDRVKVIVFEKRLQDEYIENALKQLFK